MWAFYDVFILATASGMVLNFTGIDLMKALVGQYNWAAITTRRTCR